MSLDFPSSPSVNDTYSFGGKTWIWNGKGWQLLSSGAINDIPIGNITASTGNFTTVTGASAVFSGNVTANSFIGDGSQLTGIAAGNVDLSSVDQSIIPAANITYDLGSANLRWRDIYLANSTIYLGEVEISAEGGNLVLPSTVQIGNIILEDSDGNLVVGNPVASFSWNSATSSPASAYTTNPPILTNAHRNMRRCLLLDNGTVNYYLDPNDSTKKADGTNSVLTGADGMVMVEIPKFYVKRTVAGTITTWSVADTALPGFVVHPAFIKDGTEVDYRYYGAYDACAFDVSTSTYISGLNRDNAVGNTPNVDVTATTGDKLASVSGIYPMVGLTRAQFRTIAANRGTGWRQLDWTLFSAVQVLYLTEYQTFFSQSVLGDGNVNGTYLVQDGVQANSPNSIAGLTNSWGNSSTRGNQPSAGAKPGTAFMSYRGIENLYGNVWNWADGCIANPDGSVSANQARMWWTNNSADFSDSVKTNMTEIAVNLATGSDYISAFAATDYFFVATSVSGGSTSTFATDQWFGSTSDDRVVLVGGVAIIGAAAGVFVVNVSAASSDAARSIGGRLAF